MTGLQLPTLPNREKPVDRLDRHTFTPLGEATVVPSDRTVPPCLASQLRSMKLMTSVGEQVQVQVAGEQSFAPQDRQYCDSILSKEHSCNDQIYHV